MQGRRRQDMPMDQLPEPWPEPGDYWKCLKTDGSGEPLIAYGSLEAAQAVGNLTGGAWMICAPNGDIGTLLKHTVREHEDGTISVVQGDGSSNSILIGDPTHERGQWHGFINRGVWHE